MRDEFSVHLLNAKGIDAATRLGEIFSTALDKIEELVPIGRDRALVVTKLQEASFFAKRGIAIDPTNQDLKNKR
jgi:ribonucleotide monophosphatase NagD (HAD superfamily)